MKILIIDDEKMVGDSLKRFLSLKGLKDVTVCNSVKTGEKEIYSNSYDIILLDIIMPEKTGDVILEQAKKNGIQSEFIILSAINEVPTVVKCLKSGAYDYLLKPLQNELMLSTIKKAYDNFTLKTSFEVITSSHSIEVPVEFNNFYTNDMNMKKLMICAQRLSLMDCNILISGETGTGKEVFAQAIHNLSNRKKNHFIGININAIPTGLFESTLFGHKKGSFTGAIDDREGLCKKADGGTLFLDEIGDLDISSQIKLLRLIEERQFYPVGSDQIENSNFRLIAATNKDLYKEVLNGTFRNDLYYRLKSGHIYIPPIRERGNDILHISHTILNDLSEQNKIQKTFKPDSIYKLLNYDFPGNFRELRHIVEYAYYNCPAKLINSDYIHYEEEISNKNADLQKIFTIEEMKKQHIIKVLNIFKTKKQAAQSLGISTVQLYNYIKKYNLQN